MQEQNLKTEFDKNMVRFVELSVWFLIIVSVIFAIIFYNWYCHKNYSRYQIFLQDVDGIIVGSPVRMLGIQVGYVKHIKLVNDMVYVDFVIDKKGVEIPKGSKITVEFSGLGGSKSLEVYAPNEAYDTNKPQLIIQQPRRLGASVRLLYQMFKKIGDIIYRCTYFSESLDFNSLNKFDNDKNEKSETEILNDVNKWLDEQNSKK